MTNALTEIAFILVSVAFGILGFPIWVVAVMVTLGLCWWGFVHHGRLKTMVKTTPWGTFGTVAIALGAITLGHCIGYGVGRAFHEIIGL